MASTKPAMLSSLPVVSQVSAYLRPFWTEQYHTMMPSRSCNLLTNQRSVFRSRDQSQPIRDQYYLPHRLARQLHDEPGACGALGAKQNTVFRHVNLQVNYERKELC